MVFLTATVILKLKIILGNSEFLPVMLLGLPLFPEGVIPAAQLAVAREACGWGRNFPLIKNKVVCDPGEERDVRDLLRRRPESEIQPADRASGLRCFWMNLWDLLFWMHHLMHNQWRKMGTFTPFLTWQRAGLD